MFQFPRFAPFGDRVLLCRVSPFGNLRVNACLPAHRSLSQAPTSFIASQRQGIHQTPLSCLTLIRLKFAYCILECDLYIKLSCQRTGWIKSLSCTWQRVIHNQVTNSRICSRWCSEELIILFKGGDPAAGSPTATLLRLHPSRWPHRGRLLP